MDRGVIEKRLAETEEQLVGGQRQIAEQREAIALLERSGRAEQWLHKIYTDVEERFIRQPEEKRRSVLALGRRA